MSLGKKNLPPDRVDDKPQCEFDESFQNATNDDDDDLVISQAYDMFVTQTTNQTKSIQRPENDPEEDNVTFEKTKDSSKVHDKEEKRPQKNNTTVEDIEQVAEVSEINYLEDLVTLEDLREVISPSYFAEPESQLFPDIPENEWLDLNEASTIANITIVKIFDRCWKTIKSKQDTVEMATLTLMEIFNRAWKTITPRSRWRQPDPSSWRRNIAKKRRADGLPYVTAKKIRQPKIPKDVDCSRCKYRCTVKISSDDRDYLCRKYWDLDYAAKKNFILNLIQVTPIKTTVVARKRATPRSNNKQYFFKIDGLELQVCQSFFCKTLCISPSVVTDAVAKCDSMGTYSRKSDPRGRHEPINKTPARQLQEVHEHINAFPTMESHYVRKRIKRKYCIMDYCIIAESLQCTT
ncbi:hypothetical protein O0L34_g6719 [Tuta absoluta]|nr:hypothetical protein O0L34_g6719 [Tuta absoluta]